LSVLYLLVPIALMLAGIGVAAFRWAVRDGQFDDLDSPAVRILFEEKTYSGPRGSEASDVAQ